MGESTLRQHGVARPFLLGTMYLSGGMWLTYILNFVITIAVARLLGPKDLGMYAFVAAVNEFLNLVSAFSVGHALLQARLESDALNDTAYGIAAGLGGISLGAALLVAPLLGVYRSPLAGWFVLILGLARIPMLLAGIPIALMERSLQYGRLAVVSVITGNVPNLCALGLAWLGFGPWSLLARDVVMSLLTFVLTRLWWPKRFRLRLHRTEARQILSFSNAMFVSRSLDTVNQRLDRLAVGSFFGDTVLGLYHQARFLSEIGSLAVRPIQQLCYNLYCRLQDAESRLSRASRLVNYFLMRTSYAGAALFLTFPEVTIKVLLGEAWTGASPFLRILGIYAALLPLLDNLQWLLYASGRMKENIQLRLIQMVVLLPAIAGSGLAGSPVGAAIGLVASTIVGCSVAIWFTRALLRGALLAILAIPTAVLAVTVAICLGLRGLRFLDGVPAVVLLPIPPAVFASLLLMLERTTLLREIGYLRDQFLRTSHESKPTSTEAGAS
jgi:PST family polysaccharide transporter